MEEIMAWRNIKENKELITLAAKSRAFVFFDTETTGLKKTDEIIEFAACKCIYSKEGFAVYDFFHIFIKPTNPVPENITELTGLTNEFLSDKMSEAEAFPLIHSFLGDDPVVGAYNSAFDVKMLTAMYDRQGHEFHVNLEVDFLKIARDIFCDQKIKDHKLCTVANTYGVDEGITFHSAMDDVYVLIRVANAMIQDMKEASSASPKTRAKVYHLNYYPMHKGLDRIYAATSAGMVFYEFMHDRWGAGKNCADLSSIDMEDLERQVFTLAGCNDYKSLKDKCANGDIPSFSNA